MTLNKGNKILKYAQLNYIKENKKAVGVYNPINRKMWKEGRETLAQQWDSTG